MVETLQIILFPGVSRKPGNTQADKGEPAPSFPGEGIAVMSSSLTRNQRTHLGEKCCNYLMGSKKIQGGLPHQSTMKDNA